MTHYQWVARLQRANALRRVTASALTFLHHRARKRRRLSVLSPPARSVPSGPWRLCVYRAREVELIQRVLQRLDFVLQFGDVLVHVHLAELGNVFDFVGCFAESASLVEHAALGFERGQRSDKSLEFRQPENL